MRVAKREIDLDRLRRIFESEPDKKREVCESLHFNRQTISKVLGGKRGIEGGELLTIAEVCQVDPMELAQ